MSGQPVWSPGSEVDNAFEDEKQAELMNANPEDVQVAWRRVKLVDAEHKSCEDGFVDDAKASDIHFMVEEYKSKFLREFHVHTYPRAGRAGRVLVLSMDEGRPGAGLERNFATAALRTIGFCRDDITIICDPSRKVLTEEVIKFRQQDWQDHACALVCAMAHGFRYDNQDFIELVDDYMHLDEIYGMLSKKEAPGLADRPKMFFIQSCRAPPNYPISIHLADWLKSKEVPFNEEEDYLIVRTTARNNLANRLAYFKTLWMSVAGGLADAKIHDFQVIVNLVTSQVFQAHGQVPPTECTLRSAFCFGKVADLTELPDPVPQDEIARLLHEVEDAAKSPEKDFSPIPYYVASMFRDAALKINCAGNGVECRHAPTKPLPTDNPNAPPPCLTLWPRFTPLPTDNPNAVTTSKLAQSKTVRLADGGFNDNTSVAYALNRIQQRQSKSEPVTMVLFMNASYKDAASWKPEVSQGIDLLFGNGQNGGRYLYSFSDRVHTWTPHPQVFQRSDWTHKAKLQFEEPNGDVLCRYYTVPFTTVDNKVFNVQGGWTGVLHIFNSVHLKSDALPWDANVLNTYTSVYKATLSFAVKHKKVILKACRPPSGGRCHISISGGGHHSFSATAAWFAPLLEAEFWENVGIISANSGGSWFLGLLAYSSKFCTWIREREYTKYYLSVLSKVWKKSKLETEAAIKSNGFKAVVVAGTAVAVGKTKQQLLAVPCLLDLNWETYTKKLAYLDGEFSDVLLSSQTLPWARSLELVFACALPVDGVQLDVTLGSSNPFGPGATYLEYELDKAPTDLSRKLCQNYVPTMFVRLSSGSARMIIPSGGLRLAYWQTKKCSHPLKNNARTGGETANIQSNQNASRVTLMQACTASSAAVGLMASRMTAMYKASLQDGDAGALVVADALSDFQLHPAKDDEDKANCVAIVDDPHDEYSNSQLHFAPEAATDEDEADSVAIVDEDKLDAKLRATIDQDRCSLARFTNDAAMRTDMRINRNKVELEQEARRAAARESQIPEIEKMLKITSTDMANAHAAWRKIQVAKILWMVIIIGCELDVYGFAMAFFDYWNAGADVHPRTNLLMRGMLIVGPSGYLLAILMYMGMKNGWFEFGQHDTAKDSHAAAPAVKPGLRERLINHDSPELVSIRDLPKFASFLKVPNERLSYDEMITEAKQEQVHLKPYHFLPFLRYFLLVKDAEQNDVESLFKVNALSSFSLGFAQIACMLLGFCNGSLVLDIKIKVGICAQLVNFSMTVLYYFTTYPGRMKSQMQVEALRSQIERRNQEECCRHMDLLQQKNNAKATLANATLHLESGAEERHHLNQMVEECKSKVIVDIISYSQVKIDKSLREHTYHQLDRFRKKLVITHLANYAELLA